MLDAGRWGGGQRLTEQPHMACGMCSRYVVEASVSPVSIYMSLLTATENGWNVKDKTSRRWMATRKNGNRGRSKD